VILRTITYTQSTFAVPARMDVQEAQILQIGATLLGGGAVGAIITGLVSSYRGRVQPIGKRVEVSALFASDFGGANFSTSVTVSDGSADYKFSNLHVADVQLVNRGNRDLATFDFGITLTDGDKVVHVEPSGLDRHHTATLKRACAPSSPSSVLDFELRPFNRGDSYTMRLFIVAASDEPGAISIGSSEPVRFTEIPSVVETIAEAARTVSIGIGPLVVSVGSRR